MTFKEQIYYDKIMDDDGWGLDGSETHLISTQGTELYADANPYRIDKKYLSLFKLSIRNTSNEIQAISIEDFQIASDRELLYPFKIQYFENTLKGEDEKMKYIYRMNMPDELKLGPDQVVDKYISTPAINIANNVLKASYIYDNQVIDFPFSVSAQTINEKQNFSRYTFSSKGESAYYVIELPNGVLFPLKSNALYINDKDVNSNFKVYSIALHGRGVYYAEKDFIPVNNKKRKIRLTYDSVN